MADPVFVIKIEDDSQPAAPKPRLYEPDDADAGQHDWRSEQKFSPDRSAERQLEQQNRLSQEERNQALRSDIEGERLPDDLAHLNAPHQPQQTEPQRVKLEFDDQDVSPDRSWEKQLEQSQREHESPKDLHDRTSQLIQDRPDVRGAQAQGSFDAQAGAGEAAEGGAELAGEAAAGPAGLAVMAAKKAEEEWVKSMQDMRQHIEGTSRTLQDFAGNNNRSGLERIGDGFADLEEKIPAVGKAMAETTRTILALEKSFAEVTDAFVQRGREIGQYSPELSAANAMTDVRELMADIKEAQTMGPDLADLASAQEDVSIAIREALLPIKEVIVKDLVPIIKAVAQIIEAIAPLGEDVAEAIDDILDMIQMGVEAVVFLAKQAKDVTEIFTSSVEQGIHRANRNKPPDPQELWASFRDAVGRGRPTPMMGEQLNPADVSSMNRPAVIPDW